MMNEITLGKLFELYVNIFDKFGIYLLNETDEMLDYYVFEATDINIGYCSRRILMRFLEEGLIDENIFENSLLFIKKFRKLESTMLIRNAESIRNSFEWMKLMELSDNIKNMIKTRWTNEELQWIFKFEQSTNLNI